jgi:hypothetical protein
MSLPAHIEPPIRIGIGLDVAANQTARHLALLQHDPLALKRKRQLRSDITPLALAQDLGQSIRHQIQRPVQIIGSGRDD